MRNDTSICITPNDTFKVGQRIAATLGGGEIVLLRGGLGVGKTLLTKGILGALGFDVDEVTSPSFTLVNLYKTSRFDVYHIDLWRLDAGSDVAAAVGLDEIIEEPKAVVIVEWAERLGGRKFGGRTIEIDVSGDGDDPRSIAIVETCSPKM